MVDEEASATKEQRVFVKTSVVEANSLPIISSTAATTPLRRRPPLRAKSGDHDTTPSTVVSSDDDCSVTSHRTTPKVDTSCYEWKLGWMRQAEDNSITVRLRQPVTGDAFIRIPSDALGIDVLVTNPAGQYPHDLVTLEHFNEPTVVECLQKRYTKGLIYTSTGPVLLAVNPFEHLSHVYGEEVMEQYWLKVEKSTEEPLPPHVYAMADNSFRAMMRGIQMAFGRKLSYKFDQSILVSGESGSGKTVTTKYLMKYLAALSRRAATQGARSGTTRAYQMAKQKSNESFQQSLQPDTRQATFRHHSDILNAALLRAPQSVTTTDGRVPEQQVSSSSIEAQVLQSNPILESFGNARTIRNDNSSRFGKFIEMQFTRTGRLVGTRIQTYLLEKVRLITQSPGERNYHIFYELLSGEPTAEELEGMHLPRGSSHRDFKILSSGTLDRRDGVLDNVTFQNLRDAMKMIGFSENERHDVFSVAAAILHGSNLTFLETDDEGSMLDKSNPSLSIACELFGVTEQALSEALCFFSISTKDKTFRKPQTSRNAAKGLDALLKATYGALFTFLVQRVNTSIAFQETSENRENPGAFPVAKIGVLDIFGFESLDSNSFEQLCINYCNEALQQQFNTFMLKNEQAEYAAEGVDWDFVKFPENQDVLDLIGHRSYGIMSILDDMCRAPGATDKAFALETLRRCDSVARFEAGHKTTKTPRFTIHHFAGPVLYSTDGFVEKNRDDLPRETVELLMRSSSSFIHVLGEIISSAALMQNSPADKEQRRDATLGSRPTVGGHFLQQVKNLRSKIDSTSPHYVRCVKPNDRLVPNRFEPIIVAHQLRCGGILQAVRVTRSGFTLHYTHGEFVKRYQVLALGKHRQIFSDTLAPKASADECKRLIKDLKRMLPQLGTEQLDDCEDLSNVPIQLGKSKVLLKHQAFEALERMLGSMQNERATSLNAMFRRFLCRIAFLSVRETFHDELRQLGQSFDEWFHENREIYYQPRDKTGRAIPNLVKLRMAMLTKNAGASAVTVPRSKKTLSLQNAAWTVVDGLWTRNPTVTLQRYD